MRRSMIMSMLIEISSHSLILSLALVHSEALPRSRAAAWHIEHLLNGDVSSCTHPLYPKLIASRMYSFRCLSVQEWSVFGLIELALFELDYSSVVLPVYDQSADRAMRLFGEVLRDATKEYRERSMLSLEGKDHVVKAFVYNSISRTLPNGHPIGLSTTTKA